MLYQLKIASHLRSRTTGSEVPTQPQLRKSSKHDQVYYTNILQQCKQILRQDKIFIRSRIKEADEDMIAIFRRHRRPLDLNSLQLGLRKHVNALKTQFKTERLAKLKENICESHSIRQSIYQSKSQKEELSRQSLSSSGSKTNKHNNNSYSRQPETTNSSCATGTEPVKQHVHSKTESANSHVGISRHSHLWTEQWKMHSIIQEVEPEQEADPRSYRSKSSDFSNTQTFNDCRNRHDRQAQKTDQDQEGVDVFGSKEEEDFETIIERTGVRDKYQILCSQSKDDEQLIQEQTKIEPSKTQQMQIQITLMEDKVDKHQDAKHHGIQECVEDVLDYFVSKAGGVCQGRYQLTEFQSVVNAAKELKFYPLLQQFTKAVHAQRVKQIFLADLGSWLRRHIKSRHNTVWDVYSLIDIDRDGSFGYMQFRKFADQILPPLESPRYERVYELCEKQWIPYKYTYDDLRLSTNRIYKMADSLKPGNVDYWTFYLMQVLIMQFSCYDL